MGALAGRRGLVEDNLGYSIGSVTLGSAKFVFTFLPWSRNHYDDIAVSYSNMIALFVLIMILLLFSAMCG